MQRDPKSERTRPTYCRLCLAVVRAEKREGAWIKVNLDGSEHECKEERDERSL